VSVPPSAHEASVRGSPASVLDAQERLAEPVLGLRENAVHRGDRQPSVAAVDVAPRRVRVRRAGRRDVAGAHGRGHRTGCRVEADGRRPAGPRGRRRSRRPPETVSGGRVTTAANGEPKVRNSANPNQDSGLSQAGGGTAPGVARFVLKRVSHNASPEPPHRARPERERAPGTFPGPVSPRGPAAASHGACASDSPHPASGSSRRMRSAPASRFRCRLLLRENPYAPIFRARAPGPAPSGPRSIPPEAVTGHERAAERRRPPSRSPGPAVESRVVPPHGNRVGVGRAAPAPGGRVPYRDDAAGRTRL